MTTGIRASLFAPSTLSPEELLCAAAESGDAGSVAELLAAGADPTHPGASGLTPLMHAVVGGHATVVRLLLDVGAPCIALSASSPSPTCRARSRPSSPCPPRARASSSAPSPPSSSSAPPAPTSPTNAPSTPRWPRGASPPRPSQSPLSPTCTRSAAAPPTPAGCSTECPLGTAPSFGFSSSPAPTASASSFGFTPSSANKTTASTLSSVLKEAIQEEGTTREESANDVDEVGQGTATSIQQEALQEEEMALHQTANAVDVVGKGRLSGVMQDVLQEEVSNGTANAVDRVEIGTSSGLLQGSMQEEVTKVDEVANTVDALGQVNYSGIGKGHLGAVGSVAFSKKSKNFFVSGISDRTVKIWNWDDALNDADDEVSLKAKAVVAAHDEDIKHPGAPRGNDRSARYLVIGLFFLEKWNLRTTLRFTRWNADWKNATSLYEQAAIAYRFRKDNEKAKDAFEKASKGQEMISSPWDAAKHMESAGSLAKELGRWNEASHFYRRASELYRECGRPQPASDALAKGVSALEDKAPEEAIKMYDEACSVLEEDGKEQMAFDLYRAAASLYVKLEKYVAAAAYFLRLGAAADKCNAMNSQCKGRFDDQLLGDEDDKSTILEIWFHMQWDPGIIGIILCHCLGTSNVSRGR